MAKSQKPRKKYRKLTFGTNPLLVLENLSPLSLRDQMKFSILAHETHTRLVIGPGTMDDAMLVGGTLNVSELMGTKYLVGHDWLAEILAAQQALGAMMARGEEAGVYAYTKVEKEAVDLALEVHDAQLEDKRITPARIDAIVADLERMNCLDQYLK